MQYFMVFPVLSALSTLLTLSFGAILPRSPPNYISDPIKWTGLGESGNITLYGTATEIRTQLKESEPDWEPVTTSLATRRSLKPRADPGIICCPVASWDWPSVSASDALEVSEDFVNEYTGGPKIMVQPNTCQQVECSRNVGIWLCNESNGSNEQYTNVVGQYAFNIANECPSVGGFVPFLCGQHFSPPDDNFNVLLHGC